jgi:serine/threonine protein kinase
LFFVTDYLPGGDLFFHLSQRVKQSRPGFAEAEAKVLLAEVVLGLEHLHGHGYVHRDVKAENVCLDGHGHVKLIDMGLAKELPRAQSPRAFQSMPLSLTGSLIYMAPELLRESRGGRHTDWWAVGVLAHELLTGRTPWSSLTDKKVIRREIKTLRVGPPIRLSPPAGLLICSLLQQDPTKRLGTSQPVRSSPFFGALDWSAAEVGELPPAFARPSTCFRAQDRKRSLDAYTAQRRHHDETVALGGAKKAEAAQVPSGEDFPDEDWLLGLEYIIAHPVAIEKDKNALVPSAAQEGAGDAVLHLELAVFS